MLLSISSEALTYSQPEPGNRFAIVDLHKEPGLQDFPQFLAAVLKLLGVGPNASQPSDFTEIASVLEQLVLGVP
jgi:hypothetical protein